MIQTDVKLMSSAEKQSLREKNMETIKKFFSAKARTDGGSKYRAGFFTNDGVKVVRFPIGDYPDYAPPVYPAKELLNNQPDLEKNMDLYGVLWSCEDPDFIWAQVKITGKLPYECSRNVYHGFCIHNFEMKDGLIAKWETTVSVRPVFDALDIEIYNPPVKQSQESTANPDSIANSPEERARAAKVYFENEPIAEAYTVDPVIENGLSTRLKVHVEYDDSPEAEELRKKCVKTVQDFFSMRVAEPGGRNWRAQTLYAKGGVFSIPYENLPDGSLYVTSQEGDQGEPTPSWIHWFNILSPTADPKNVWCRVRGAGGKYSTVSGKVAYGFWHEYIFHHLMNDEGKIIITEEFLDSFYLRRFSEIENPELPEEAKDFFKHI